jgi:Mg2+ and Co2+ transporter CorA
MMDQHVINFDKAKEIETEIGLISLQNRMTIESKQSKVIFYSPFHLTFTQIEKYQTKEIMSIFTSYQKENFFIIEIDNDYILYEEIIKFQFKSEFENIYKLFDLKLDYCFSPVDGLLCFNLSVLTNIDCDEIEKFLIQIFFTENGVYIINKDDCQQILNIFKKKFNFKEQSSDEFFKNALIVDRKSFLINDISLADKQMMTNNEKVLTKRKSCILSNKKEPLNKKNSKTLKPVVFSDEIFNDNTNLLNSTMKESPDEKITQLSSKVQESSKDTQDRNIILSNFSTDDLIYHLLVMSLDRLEDFADSLIKESESLKGIYLELSEKERKDFFRRIHNMEISLQLIYSETIIKKKFLKHSKAQFKIYNKLSQNFYFKKTFNFFIELMISKVTQLEITFEKLENTIRMIKENYSIIIEDNTEKQNIKLNFVMKVLAMVSTLYIPLNLLPNIFGMNVKLPFQDYDNYWPFFGILGLAIMLVIIIFFAFKKLKWLDD